MAKVYFSPTAVAKFRNFTDGILAARNYSYDFASYMQVMDAMYAREESCVDTYNRRLRTPGNFKHERNANEFIAPIILPQVEAARAYLVNLFLAQDPIFQATAPKLLIDAATRFNLLQKRDADREGWRTELNMALVAGLKYNLMCVEVDYVTRTSAEQGPNKGAKILRSSNSIKFVDLYNAFWDTSVPARKIASEGMYAGYSEFCSRIKIIKWWEELPADSKIVNLETVLAAPLGRFQVQQPIIKGSMFGTKHIKDLGADTQGITRNFSTFFENTATAKIIQSSTRTFGTMPQIEQFKGFVRTVAYVRIIPKEFGLKLPADDKVQIWKCWYVGDTLVAAQQQTNEHNTLGMVFAEPLADGLDYQTLSFAENLADFQTIISKLWSAELKSTDRAIGDRAIYNPLAINGNHFNRTQSASPKIPIRDSWAGMGADLGQAYREIPFNDPAMGTRIQQANFLMGIAEKTSGLNPTLQGAFVKGNKTDGQFQETIQGTEARLLLIALTLETDFFTPIKEIIKANCLQYQTAETLFDPVSQKNLDITAEQLRSGQLEFELGDGLAASAARAMLPVMGQAFQVIQSDPSAKMRWDALGMFAYYAKVGGFRRIDDFQYSPEQVQQNIQAMQAQAQIANGQGQGAANAQSGPPVEQTPTQ